MATHSTPRRSRRSRGIAYAAMAAAAGVSLPLASPAQADSGPTTITITGRSGGDSASVSGFGDVALHKSPFSATVITTSQLADAGIAGLGDLTRLDAGTTDAYNAPGYWGLVAVRGFTLDPQFNYRRDGLPINAETVVPLANKRSLELLKGTSGLQAGTSAPGGLVNLSVKRPAGRLRSVGLQWTEDHTNGLTVDLGDGDGRLGWRVNAEVAHLEPKVRASRGHRRLVALAGDSEPVAGTLIEVEAESSTQRQPSTPGLSVLGTRLPDPEAIDPRLNLNNQSWTLPVVMQGQTGSLRLTQALPRGAQLVLHAMRQRLASDDRIAFPFGCSAENDYTRYCSDGSFDLYDYRSEGERRVTTVVDLALSGQLDLPGSKHRWALGFMRHRHTAKFQRQAYNWVGIGTLDGLARVPADPSLTEENTLRDEDSGEWRVQDRVDFGRSGSLWIGVRQTSLERRSVRTDGSRITAYRQSFAAPWVAFSRPLGPRSMVYASLGQGIETTVAPNRARYVNAGQALPALRSRGTEFGYKLHGEELSVDLAFFDVRRPEWADLGPCDDALSCLRQADGTSRHRGVESDLEWRHGAWALRASAMLLRARRVGSSQPGVDGSRPTNVPAHSVKGQLAYNVPAMPGVAVMAFLTHEGPRMVLPDNSLQTPGWTRWDMALRVRQHLQGGELTWRVGVDNVADARAWKEAPYQFGHAYLYPLAPRSLSLSVQIGV